MSIFGKIKTYATAIFAALAGILFFFWRSSATKAKNEAAANKRTKGAIKAQASNTKKTNSVEEKLKKNLDNSNVKKGN